MNIIIRTIPHANQKYETVGDYREKVHGDIEIVVSNLRDARMEFLIGIHEAIEAGLMHFAGIPLQSSTDFDAPYELDRLLVGNGLLEVPNRADAGIIECDCQITETSEPGDDKHAPYYRQHQFATAVERMLAVELGVDWNTYTERCEKAGSPE